MEQDVSRWLSWILFMVIFALFLYLRQRRGKRENRFKKMLKGWNLQSPLCFRDFLTLKAWLKLAIKREEGKITISPFPYLFFGCLLFGAVAFVFLFLLYQIGFPEGVEFLIVFAIIFVPICSYLHYKTLKKAIYDLEGEI